MADVKAVDEGGEFPEKRKLDLPVSKPKPLEDAGDKDDFSKRQKIEAPAGKNGEKAAESEEHVKSVAAAVEEDEDDEEDEEDYNAEQEEDGEDEVYGEAGNVDRKGKGVVVDRKGKGKMIEESDEDDSDGRVDDDDDDSSDDSGSDFSDGLDESDLEEDPLAEVDLDNILPSRTRRSRAQPGVRISGDPDKGEHGTCEHTLISDLQGNKIFWLLLISWIRSFISLSRIDYAERESRHVTAPSSQ